MADPHGISPEPPRRQTQAGGLPCQPPQAYHPPGGTYPAPGAAPAAAPVPPSAAPEGLWAAAPETPGPGYPPAPQAGRPSAQGAPPAAAPPAVEQRKSRRVGVYTMSLCLIAAGVVLLLSAFLPNLDYLFIARLFPLALVLLGVELLVSAVRHRSDKLRFDFLTVFICLVLIGGSVVAAAVPQVIRAEVQGGQVGRRLEAELEAGAHTALAQAGAPKVTQLDWYVGVEGAAFSVDMEPADIRPEHTVQLRVGLLGSYADAAAFAADCRAALRLLRPLVPHLDYVSFYSVDPADPGRAGPVTATQYNLWLDGPYQIDDGALPLEDYIEVYPGVDEDAGYEDEDYAA